MSSGCPLKQAQNNHRKRHSHVNFWQRKLFATPQPAVPLETTSMRSVSMHNSTCAMHHSGVPNMLVSCWFSLRTLRESLSLCLGSPMCFLWHACDVLWPLARDPPMNWLHVGFSYSAGVAPLKQAGIHNHLPQSLKNASFFSPPSLFL